MLKAKHNKTRGNEEEVVVTKALKKAAEYWGINNRQLGGYIGLSEAIVSRLKKDKYILSDTKKEWELAVIFLRIFRGLDAYMGKNVENEKAWLSSNNKALGGVPLDLMSSIEGMTSVVQYVDYIRGQ